MKNRLLNIVILSLSIASCRKAELIPPNSGIPDIEGVSALVAKNETKVVTTVAELRRTAIQGGVTYETTDYGGGKWRYDSTDRKSADNTGTILLTKDGKRVKRIYQGAVNALWFGAKGDGLSNNTPAFNELFKFSKIEIPAGSFRLCGPVLSTTAGPLDVQCGAGTNLFLNDYYPQGGVKNSVFTFQNKTSIKWTGGKFEGRRTTLKPAIKNWTNYIYMINISGSSNISISNVTMANFPSIGIYVGTSSQISIANCNFSNGLTHPIHCERSKFIKIDHNRINGGGDMGPAGTGIGLGGIGVLVTLSSDIEITNNLIEDTPDTGSKTEGCDRVLYAYNTLRRAGKDGLKVQGYLDVKRESYDVKMIGNYVEQLKYWRTDGSGGLMFQGVHNGIMKDNTFVGGNKGKGEEDGIRITSYDYKGTAVNDNLTVSNNTILNAQNAGIIATNINNSQIVNNRVIYKSSPTAPKAGLLMDLHKNVVVSSNTFTSDVMTSGGTCNAGGTFKNFKFTNNNSNNYAYGLLGTLNGSDSLIVSNNTFSNTGSYAIRFNGSNSSTVITNLNLSGNYISKSNMKTVAWAGIELDGTNCRINEAKFQNTRIFNNGANPISYSVRLRNGQWNTVDFRGFKVQAGAPKVYTQNCVKVLN